MKGLEKLGCVALLEACVTEVVFEVPKAHTRPSLSILAYYTSGYSSQLLLQQARLPAVMFLTIMIID